MADEANHRDVNHTFAGMKSDDPSPFVHEHKEKAAIAWRVDQAGETAWVSPTIKAAEAAKPATEAK